MQKSFELATYLINASLESDSAAGRALGVQRVERVVTHIYIYIYIYV